MIKFLSTGRYLKTLNKFILTLYLLLGLQSMKNAYRIKLSMNWLIYSALALIIPFSYIFHRYFFLLDISTALFKTLNLLGPELRRTLRRLLSGTLNSDTRNEKHPESANLRQSNWLTDAIKKSHFKNYMKITSFAFPYLAPESVS